MHHRLLFRGKFTGALQNQVNTFFTPWGFQGIAGGVHPNTIAIHNHVLTIDGHGSRKTPVSRVVLRKVGINVDISHGINRHNVDITLLVLNCLFIQRSQHHASDSAIAINCNSDGHLFFLFTLLTNIALLNHSLQFAFGIARCHLFQGNHRNLARLSCTAKRLKARLTNPFGSRRSNL